jgi:hypothetical protein
MSFFEKHRSPFLNDERGLCEVLRQGCPSFDSMTGVDWLLDDLQT